jgi:hypothetical protein
MVTIPLPLIRLEMGYRTEFIARLGSFAINLYDDPVEIFFPHAYNISTSSKILLKIGSF